jgi:D-cysteine desulfhydrase family pyridoxal phosphate-dependent enzyme
MQLPRVPLAILPTPVYPLPHLSALLGGPQLWIKRDDLTGLAFGGNKTRKLELLLAEAEGHGARMLITTGALQSNHCRQTAAAAAKRGMACALVLRAHRPASLAANTLLDHLLGAELVYCDDLPPDEVVQRTFQSAQDAGRRPYNIPYGGSNALGASAYATALKELASQQFDFDRIVLATSSGGTQAGMLVGALQLGFKGHITGISVDQTAVILKPLVARLATDVLGLLGDDGEIQPGQVEVEDGYIGEGYGMISDVETHAIRLFAEQEGILLDPVYTGRAAGGMMAMIERGQIQPEEKVLFWHTGGTPALFAYSQALQPAMASSAR